MLIDRKHVRDVSLIVAAFVIVLSAQAANGALLHSPYLFRQPDASAPAPIPGVELKYHSAGDRRISGQYI
jgi:hypothetical protein